MFTIFGIKVKPQLIFFFVIGFIGFGFVQNRLELLPIWIAIAFASVLIHELGHALVARSYGNEPEIEFLFFGAVTKFSSKGITPARNAIIAAAGPLAGIAAALPGAIWMLTIATPMETLIALLDPSQGFAILSSVTTPAIAVAVWSLTWTGGVWGILNLAPVRSVDGGQILAGVIKTITPRYGVPLSEALFGLTFLAGIGWALLTRNWWIGLIIFLFGRPDINAVRTWFDRRKDGDAFDVLDQAEAAYQAGRMPEALTLADQAHATAQFAATRSRADLFRVASRLATGRLKEAADIAAASHGLEPRIRLQALAADGRHQEVADLVGTASGLSAAENSSVIFALIQLGRSGDAIARARREPADIGVLLQALRASQHDGTMATALSDAITAGRNATPAQLAEAALLTGNPAPALATPGLDDALVAAAVAWDSGLVGVDQRFPDLEARAVSSVQIALHRSRRYAEAVEFANRHRFSDNTGLLSYNRAASEARLGRADEAIASLRTARRSGFDIAVASRDPDFESMRSELEALLG